MASEGGLIFGIINIVGNFGTVFVDQSYWQSAVAAKPAASVPGFLIGGMVWFAIPFCLATTFGLTTAALNIPISMDEVNAGLTAAKGATAVMGTGGGVGILVMLFMAVTSTGSAELIAVCSLFTYDVYSGIRSDYLDTLVGESLDNHLKKVSRIFIVVFGILMGLLAIVLQAIGLSLGYVYLMMGVLVGSAVAPCFCTVVWNSLNGYAAASAITGGFVCSVSSWLITAALMNDGVLTLATTGQDIPLLVGNVVALSMGALICIVGTMISPQPCKWEAVNANIKGEVCNELNFVDQEEFEKYRNISVRSGIALSFFLIVVWPMPMYFSKYVFDKPFFTFWIVVCFIWSTLASLVIIVLPLVDAYKLYKEYKNGAHKADSLTSSEHGAEQLSKGKTTPAVPSTQKGMATL
jgi:Na+/proline symporter